MSVYALADLHGILDVYQQIKDFLKPEDKVYYLGDASDRGPDSWELVKTIYKDPQFIYIRGNHEQMLIDSAEEHIKYEDDWFNENLQLLFQNGGYETFNDWLMEEYKSSWIAELKKLPLTAEYVNKDGITILMSHAGYTPIMNKNTHKMVQPTDYRLIWDRKHIYDIWDNKNFPNILVVHGHTPLPSLARRLGAPTFEWGAFWYASNHKVDIDNGCCDTGVACLFDLDTFDEHIFVGEINEKDYI